MGRRPLVDREVIEHLDSVWSSMAELCADLGDSEWNLPTDCPGWTVRDQVAHVVGTEMSLLGHESPAPAPVRSFVHNELGAANQAWVEFFRELPASEALARFAAITKQRIGDLRGMPGDQLLAESDTFLGRMPYAEFLRVRRMDCWVHEQDIRAAVERPGGLGSNAAGAAVDLLLQPLGYVLAKKVRADEGTVVNLHVHGPVERRRTVQLSDGRGREVEPAADASAVVFVDTTAFARLATGRWDAERAFAEGRVECRGDRELGRALLANLATTP